MNWRWLRALWWLEEQWELVKTEYAIWRESK